MFVFFLIYRFNPWRITKCNSLDKRIAFSAGFFLLSTTIFENILTYFVSKTKSHIKNIKNKFESKNLDSNKKKSSSQ